MSDIARPGSIMKSPSDERISHRGPIQRLLVSPEIGALVGAILIWAFFWGIGATFGTAGTTLNVLDSAAPLGIMAVAISLLMIGGEFDLSSGVLTGSIGVLVGLMATHFMNTGAPIWFAILVAFVTAGLIGWFNGTMVNRTGLPSFIVTLSTFFALQGLNLVLAKRLSGKVLVDGAEKAKGFKFFRAIFVHEFKLPDFHGRDGIYVGLVLTGVALLTFGLLEQAFVRREKAERKSVVTALGGVIVAVASFATLLNNDGVANNIVFGILLAAGGIVALYGFGRMRFEPKAWPTSQTDKKAIRVAAFGAASIVLACIAPLIFDRNQRKPFLTWLPSSGRVVLTVIVVLVCVAWLAIRQKRDKEIGHTTRISKRFFTLVIAATMVPTAVLSVAQLTTVQAVRAFLMMAAGSVGLVLLLRARSLASKASRSLHLIIGASASVAIAILAIVVRADSGATRFRSGLFTVMMIVASLIAANTLLESNLVKRRAADPRRDKLGRRLVASGAILAAGGVVVRIIFTNLVTESGQQKGGVSLVRMSVVWWLIFTLAGAFVLSKTKWGSWIFAVGGNKEAARSIGVPAAVVKLNLFITTSLMGCFVGVMTLMRYKTVQASQGVGLEFEYIIAAVVGGNLLTGGYGSVIGATIGAFMMAMSGIGIPTAGWNSNGRLSFIGLVLLIAVLVNNFIRRKAREAQ